MPHRPETPVYARRTAPVPGIRPAHAAPDPRIRSSPMIHTYKVQTTKGSALTIEANEMVDTADGVRFYGQSPEGSSSRPLVAFVPSHALIYAQQTTAVPAGET